VIAAACREQFLVRMPAKSSGVTREAEGRQQVSSDGIANLKLVVLLAGNRQLGS
jgi:hypothetical protein